MYSIYKTNGTIPYIKYNYFGYLNCLRLDLTEQELYNYRFIDKGEHKSNINRNHNTPLKKIGFISRDFSENRPSGQLSTLFFEILAKFSNQVEIYFYMLHKNYISNKFTSFAIIRKEKDIKNLEIKIKEDKIDILIDMQGHMHNNFNQLLLNKPAPIQIHWLGYPGTTGIPTMDYLIADEVIIPEESQKYYTEKIAYLPNCYQCNNRSLICHTSKCTRSTYNIPENAFVFCHFNSDYKLDRKTWFVWMDILKLIKNSVLLFTTSTETFKRLLITDAINYGVNKSQLIYVKRENRIDHINKLNLCNLGLDNYRVNGHTTSSDLVAAGIPFIAYTSETYHNRVAKSILISLDLEELVCYSFETYKKLAVKLATDTNYYMYVKNKIIRNRERYLFNTSLYVNNFVNLIFNIWKDNYDSNLEYIWKYYPNLDSPNNNITQVHDNFYQEAIKTNSCIAYNNKGELKNKINELVPGCGIWIKEKLKENKITKFNNNYKNIKKVEWKFYPNMDSPDNTIYHSDLRNQKLRDFANDYNDCVAFNLNGDIKDKINPLIPGCGIWIKEPITYNSNTRDQINKDYNLPLICLVYKLNHYNIDKIVDFHKSQLYLNTELLIILKEEETIKIKQLVQKNHNIKSYVNKNNKHIKEILNELKYNHFIEIFDNSNFDLRLICNFYKNNININNENS